MDKQLIISIGREFGSGGHEIAEMLAERFELNLYDKNLLEQIANDKNLNVKNLEKYVDDQNRSWIFQFSRRKSGKHAV